MGLNSLCLKRNFAAIIKISIISDFSLGLNVLQEQITFLWGVVFFPLEFHLKNAPFWLLFSSLIDFQIPLKLSFYLFFSQNLLKIYEIYNIVVAGFSLFTQGILKSNIRANIYSFKVNNINTRKRCERGL